jgi:uncharacterized protein (DUF2141 family)
MVGKMCKHRRNGRRRFVVLATLCLLGLWAPVSLARTLTLSLNDVRTAGATLYMAIYSADGGQGSWQQEPLRALKFILPKSTTAEFELDLPDGLYAIRAFVDIDGSGELETARFNRPLEPFTLSSATQQDKPSVHFANAIFPLDEEHKFLQLTLFYPQGTDGEPSEGND